MAKANHTTTAKRASALFQQVSARYDDAKQVRRVAVPKGLHPEAFGLKIDGDCLAPRARHGQIALVEPTIPKPGDMAVLWFKGQANSSAMKILCTDLDYLYPMHPDSECIPLIEIEQLNPPKRYRCALDKIACIARVHSVIDS